MSLRSLDICSCTVSWPASKVAALVTAGAPEETPKVGADELEPPRVECSRVSGLVVGAAWLKEKLAPIAGAGTDVSAGLAEKLNDGVGPVDPVEEAAVEVSVAEKEKAPDPDEAEAAASLLMTTGVTLMFMGVWS